MAEPIYVPGTEETDPKKQNMSLQQIGAAADTLTASVATNTALLAALTGSKITTSLGADVALNNTANFFDGPSVAQGSVGTWFVSGTVTVVDPTAIAAFWAKLWDGTTLIATGASVSVGAFDYVTISLSGFLATPAGNLRISCRNISTVNGRIAFNSTGLGKDSTITAFRIA